MSYEITTCPICGAENLKRTGTEEHVGQVYGVYHCLACDSFISSYKKPKTQKSTGGNAKTVSSIPSRNTRAAVVNVASDVYKKVINSTIAVVCKHSDGNISCGTGTVVSNNGYIVTNAHVVAEVSENRKAIVEFAENILVENGKGTYSFNSDLVYANPTLDLALLKTSPASDIVPVNIVSYEVEPGQDVYTIGNSKGEGLCIVEGIVSDVNRTIAENKYIMISAPVTHGNSGGPVFDSEGTLIGIVRGGRTDVSSMNYVIPASDLVKFLQEVVEKEDVKFT